MYNINWLNKCTVVSFNCLLVFFYITDKYKNASIVEIIILYTSYIPAVHIHIYTYIIYIDI